MVSDGLTIVQAKGKTEKLQQTMKHILDEEAGKSSLRLGQLLDEKRKMGITPSDEVVMAVAYGYSLKRYERFVKPLREYYDGDIVVYANPDEVKSDVVDFCKKHRVELVTDVHLNWPPFDRFTHVYTGICKHYKQCLGADFKDVFFQANPFQHSSVKNEDFDLILSEETPQLTIAQDKNYDAKWLKNCFGQQTLDEMGDKTIICSGVMLGNPKAFSVLSKLYQTKGLGCEPDQAALIYMHYKGILKQHGLKVVVQPRGSGYVNTIGIIYEQGFHAIPVNKAHQVLNDDGSVSPMVHQYDRSPELFKFFDAKLTHSRGPFLTQETAARFHQIGPFSN